MHELRLFGDVDLRGTDGNRVNSVVAQPKTLALLAYLCLAAHGRPLRRDLVISVFWPELPESNARNALNQVLHRLRQALGAETIPSLGSNEIEINRSRITCDALEFLEKLEAGQLAPALDLYEGDLLAGVNVTGAPEFERWLDDERASMRLKAFDGALKLGRTAEEGEELNSALLWYRRAMAISPGRGSAVRGLMKVLARSGNAPEAVQVYERFSARLAEEYELQPSEATRSVVESIKEAATPEAATPRSPVLDDIPRREAANQSPSTSGRSRPSKVTGKLRALVPVLLGATAVLAAVLLVSSGWPGADSLHVTTSDLIHVTSAPGLEFQPALSPDGSEVAYVEGPIGSPQIVVRSAVDLGTGESRPAGWSGEKQWFPRWTPDGASLRYWSCDDRWNTADGCTWKKVGSRGGPVQPITLPRKGRYAWSQDGTRMVFALHDTIYIAEENGREPNPIAVHKVGDSLPHSFAWSPDGTLIAYVNGNRHWRTSANVANASVWIVNAKGGDPVPITDEQHLNVSPQWLPDSRHLLFVSDRDGSRGIYAVEVGPEGPRGVPERVPGPVDPHSISVSADGKRLAYSSLTVRQNIFAIPRPPSGAISLRDDLERAVPITTGNHIIEDFDISPDGEWVAFNSSLRGDFDLYRQRLSGGEPQLLADLAVNIGSLVWSPDGTEIAFHSGDDVFVVPAEGGTPERLTDSAGPDRYPIWSPDGLMIAYSTWDGSIRRWDLWKVTRERVSAPWSDPVEITDLASPYHDWAPDGSGILCFRRSELILVSPEGELLTRRARPDGLREAYFPEFSDDGLEVYFNGVHQDGTQGIWSIPSEGGGATLVAAYDDPSLTAFDTQVGRDRFYIAFSEYEGDIWVMDLDW